MRLIVLSTALAMSCAAFTASVATAAFERASMACQRLAAAFDRLVQLVIETLGASPLREPIPALSGMLAGPRLTFAGVKVDRHEAGMSRRAAERHT